MKAAGCRLTLQLQTSERKLMGWKEEESEWLCAGCRVTATTITGKQVLMMPEFFG
jgi:hypothetical protein